MGTFLENLVICFAAVLVIWAIALLLARAMFWSQTEDDEGNPFDQPRRTIEQRARDWEGA